MKRYNHHSGFFFFNCFHHFLISWFSCQRLSTLHPSCRRVCGGDWRFHPTISSSTSVHPLPVSPIWHYRLLDYKLALASHWVAVPYKKLIDSIRKHLGLIGFIVACIGGFFTVIYNIPQMEHIFDLFKVSHGWQSDIVLAGFFIIWLGMIIGKNNVNEKRD